MFDKLKVGKGIHFIFIASCQISGKILYFHFSLDIRP